MTPTAENLPPPAAEVELLGSCSLGYINYYHSWLTHTATGQHIASWQDKAKFNYCYFHDEWSISRISFKKLDETAVAEREVRNWNMRVAFSCEEQSVSCKIFSFSQPNCGAVSVTQKLRGVCQLLWQQKLADLKFSPIFHFGWCWSVVFWGSKEFEILNIL